MFENGYPLICTEPLDVRGIDLRNWMWQIQMEGERQITNGAGLWSWNADGRRRWPLVRRAGCINVILILIINSSVRNIPIQIFLRINLRHALSTIFDRGLGRVTLFVTILEERRPTTKIRSNRAIGRDARIITGRAERFLIILLGVGDRLPWRVFIALFALLQPHVPKILFVLYKSFLRRVNIIETSHGIVRYGC